MKDIGNKFKGAVINSRYNDVITLKGRKKADNNVYGIIVEHCGLHSAKVSFIGHITTWDTAKVTTGYRKTHKGTRKYRYCHFDFSELTRLFDMNFESVLDEFEFLYVTTKPRYVPKRSHKGS